MKQKLFINVYIKFVQSLYTVYIASGEVGPPLDPMHP